ncbi:MAG: DEAD/DEAH box helicase family protein [Holosporaceae bacterium]|nr:DEAD/DEAH box helicase family protein [Holosporaceae bacterium]
MVIRTYGKTWWGQKWLDTFNGIDDENRLPRGRTYANKGAVSNIKIVKNIVTARVQGSRSTPYKVIIEFEAFSQKQTEILQQVIERSPSILSSFLNKRLSPKLYNELLNVGIKLFPSKWSEVDAECSCPDYAVPCKHIAAVLYLICDEIDRNPFVIFDLHGCNLEEIVKNFGEYKLVQKSILKIESLFDHRKAERDFKQSVLDSVDLSGIPDLKSTTFGILKSDVVFYEKKFSEKMQQFYNFIGVAKYTQEMPEEDFLKKFPDVESWENLEICLDNQHKITAVNIVGAKEKDSPQLMLNLYDFFQKIPSSLLHLLNQQLRFMHMVSLFTMKLMEKNALIPQILQNANGENIIRWIPAIYNDQICKIIDELSQISPQIIKDMGDAQEQFFSLVAIFVASRGFFFYQGNLVGDDILNMFFAGRACKFAEFSRKEIPSAINQWLSNLYMSRKSRKLYLEIADLGDDFRLNLKIILDSQQSTEPLGLQEAFKKVSPAEKFEILSDISALAQHFPELENIIDDNGPIRFNLEDFTGIFTSILPILKAIGVSIALPKSLRDMLQPRLILDMRSSGQIQKSSGFVNLDNLLHFDWTVAIGDKNISLAEFKKLLQKSKGLVRFANNYVLLDEKQIESLLKKIDHLPQGLSQSEILQAGLAEEYESASVKMDNQLAELFREIKQYKPKLIPQNLKVRLRPYQERGYSWLVQNIDAGFGSILADDMGLGKTLQVISTILHLKNEGHLTKEKVLIIVPTSLLTNWQHEINKFAPDLNAIIYHGNKRDFKGKFDIALTSYGLAYRCKSEFQKHSWFLLVIDEAQNIKNHSTKQTKAVKSIEARHKIAMSGTPVENRLSEYWSIFDFTNKGYLGTEGSFRKKFASPIEKERDLDCLDKFIKITEPFILRRCKSDKSIIADLPEKMENNRYCSLTKEQAAIYQQIINESMKEIETSEGIERRGLVLKLINSLKQICNHPAQYGKKPIAVMDESGKTKMLEEILGEIQDVGEKTLIFTQYAEMGKILVKLLENRFKRRVPFLHGGLTRQKRDKIIDDFQQNSQTRTLVLSLKAGGTGLNLTAANHVIHYDLWWNPAVEAQATDRAYRIGQKKNVMVHRLLATGTFEERIDEMIQSKKDLANLTVSDGEKWITELDDNQLKDIFILRE